MRTNNRMKIKILKILYENRKNDFVRPLTIQEISRMTGISLRNTSKILKDEFLSKNDYALWSYGYNPNGWWITEYGKMHYQYHNL